MRHLPLLLIGLPLWAHAQITLQPADLPSAGDTMRFGNAVLTGFDGADTGPAHVWDFSALTALTDGADTAVTVASTPLLYQFYFNNPVLYPAHDADYAVKGPDFGFQQLSLQNVYEYFKKGGGGFDNVGFGASVNGVPTSVRRQPVDRIFPLPLTMGASLVSTSNWSVSVPTLLYFGQEQVRTTTVDGWGTLFLPTDTFEVLRVRSELQRQDTVFINQFGNGFSFAEPQTVEYRWMAAGRDHPVLQVTTTAGAVTQVRFQYDSMLVGLPAMSSATDVLRLIPNPASDQVQVVVPPVGHGTLEVVDSRGRSVLGPLSLEAVRQGPLPVAWEAGVYTVVVVCEGGRSTARMVVAP